MNCRYRIVVGVCLAGWVATGVALGRQTPADEAPTITVSTTLLGSAVAAIAGSRVEVNLLMPPDTCPGHFSLTPRQAARTAESALFLTHGFEAFMRTAGDRFAGVHHPLGVRGNTMIPAVHLRLAAEVREVLTALLPAHRVELASRSEAYGEVIRELERELCESLPPLEGVPVLAALMNRELVTWMGASVTAGFPRDEALTAPLYQDLLDRARAGEVRLVIDNLQSSGRLGRRLADALGVPLVVTSNFPAAVSVDGYPDALRAAVDAVLRGLGESPASWVGMEVHDGARD